MHVDRAIEMECCGGPHDGSTLFASPHAVMVTAKQFERSPYWHRYSVERDCAGAKFLRYIGEATDPVG